VKLDILKGKTIKQIAKVIEDQGHILYLAGGNPEEAIMSVTQQHGPFAGAILAAATLFHKTNGVRPSIWEAARLWKMASEKSDRKENADVVWHGAQNIEDFMIYGGSPHGKEKPTWPVKGVEKLDPDNLFSLGNFLIAIAVCDDEAEGGGNASYLGIMIAARELREVNAVLRKSKAC